jgi:hypothetical protein
MRAGSRNRSRLLFLRRLAQWLLRPLLRPLRVVSRHLFGTFVLLGLIALGLGIHGLQEHFSSLGSGDVSWPNVFFFTFTLFFADSTVFQEFGRYPVTLEIARFLAPLATAAGLADAAGTLFARRWEAYRARHQHDHVVVCGMTATARALVDKLCADGRHVVYIAEDAADAFPDGDRPATLLRVAGDPREQSVLAAASVAHAEVVYACLDDSAANASIAQATKLLVLASSPGSRDAPLRCIARVDTPGLVTGLRARRLRAGDSTVFRLDFFAADEVGARALLDRHRPAWDSGPPSRVGIVGFTSFGQALLVELARRWALAHDQAASPLPVTVLDPNASRSLHYLRRRHRILDAVAVDPIDVSPFDFEALDFTDALLRAAPGEPPTPEAVVAERQPRYVYICRDDDEVSLLTGLEVARALYSINSHDARSGTTVIKIGRRQGFEEAFRPVTGPDAPTTTPMFDDVSGAVAVLRRRRRSAPGRPRRHGHHRTVRTRHPSALPDTRDGQRQPDGFPAGSASLGRTVGGHAELQPRPGVELR